MQVNCVLLAVATIGVHSFFSVNCFCYSVTKSCLCETLFLSRDSLRLHGHQAPLSFTIFRTLLKFISIELVKLSHHLILCYPLLLWPSIFPSIGVFSNESALLIRWPKYQSFSFSVSPSNEYSFSIDWFEMNSYVYS